MRSPILVPELGAAQLVLSVWYVKPGEAVFVGDRLVELLLAGATFEITASVSGMLAEQCARPDDRVQPGQVIGQVKLQG